MEEQPKMQPHKDTQITYFTAWNDKFLLKKLFQFINDKIPGKKTPTEITQLLRRASAASAAHSKRV